MIEVKGVLSAKVSMEGKSDFIKTVDLGMLKIQSETGNVLPRMILTFRYFDNSIEKQLNEGNTLDVLMGTTLDAPDRIEAKFKIVDAKAQSGKAEVLAVHDSLKYVSTPSIEVFEKKKAADVIKAVAEKSYKVKIEAESEDEPMNWKKAFISDKKMVDLALTHMWMSKDVPLVGITEKGEFLLKAATKIASGEYKIKITNSPKESKDYVFDWREVEEQRTLNNASTGYGRDTRVFDAEEGTSKRINFKPTLKLATASQVPTSSDVKAIPGQSIQKNENTHPKWVDAEAKNKLEWDNLSSLKLKIHSHKRYIPVSILDLVMFEEFDEKGELKENYTGLYIVTLISRTISNNQFSTYLEICRECTTDPKGKFNATPADQLLKGFLNNRLRLSMGRMSASRSGFLQSMSNDAINRVNLPGRYSAQAIDELSGQTDRNKGIIYDATDSMYDRMEGLINSDNVDRIDEGFLSGYGDFKDGMEEIDIGLNPDNYPDDLREQIEEINSQIPDPNLINEFENDVYNEGKSLADNLLEANANVGDGTDVNKIMDEFGSDSLSGMASVNDILDVWDC